MSTLSLRKSLVKSTFPFPFRSGLRQGSYASAPSEMFPFASLRKYIQANEWADIKFLRLDPDELEANWTHTAQGVTHDDTHWYMTQYFAISRAHVSVPFSKMTDDAVLTRALKRPGTDELARHAGALVHAHGYLYVPVEENNPSNAELWVVDKEALQVVETSIIEPGNAKAPWCAVNEARNLFYVSDFFDEPQTIDQIRIYQLQPYPQPGPRLTRLGSLTLTTEIGDPIGLHKVQAGIITPNNHLLIVCDTKPGTAVSGLHLFDLVTGRRRWHHRIDYDYIDIAWRDEELEGLTIWNNGTDTLVYLIRLDKDWGISLSSGIGHHDDVGILRFDAVNPWERDLL